MAFTHDGRHICESSGETNKRRALEKYNVRCAEVAQGRFDLLKKCCPTLSEWTEQYLERVQHPSTRRRYASSRANLIAFLGIGTRLSHISATRIEQFKKARYEEKIKAATLNRDLRFLAQILKQAERERFIGRSPFDLGKFFQNESRERRKPHILSWGEQKAIMAVAPPRIRALTVLGVETGMRTGEMLDLRWSDIDLVKKRIKIEKSKTSSGIRAVPFSLTCKSELLRWRRSLGIADLEFVFPSFANRRHKLQGGRKTWASTLKKAGLSYFPMYYLRHTFATRMTSAGVSPLTIAQMLGHSTSQIVPRYAQVLDSNRFDAVKKLDLLRKSAHSDESTQGD
jgi:integrase